MKSLLLALSMTVAALSLSLAPHDAEAKRLGGGKPAGMQRQAPPAATPHTPATPAQNAAPTQAAPATPAPAPAAPPATPPKRNWLGPLAGLAAGVGLAALFSHFGMGAGMGNFLSLLLMAAAAFFVIRFVMSRFAGGGNAQGAGPQLAGAGAPVPQAWQAPAPEATTQRAALDAAPVAAAPAGSAPAGVAAAPSLALPGGIAAEDFTRLAKMVFIRLQAANDAANLDDLRKFTTPELFASLRLDLQERGSAKQTTDVVQIDAQVVDVAQENNQDIVTVRFSGLIREEADAGAQPFNELWHLVRTANVPGDWAIAGITPIQ